ncbi:MAG: hypothetical protein V1750_09970 [Acidobacteriota bacterium]
MYGSELGVGVGAPEGWVFDSQSGVRQGLHAVMYRAGTTWSTATETMYVNVALLEKGQTLDAFIGEDIARYKASSPDLLVRIGETIEIGPGSRAPVRLYSGDQWGNHEAVAYALGGSSVAIYVLSCRTETGLEKSFPAFREMVAKSFLAAMVFEK